MAGLVIDKWKLFNLYITNQNYQLYGTGAGTDGSMTKPISILIYDVSFEFPSQNPYNLVLILVYPKLFQV